MPVRGKSLPKEYRIPKAIMGSIEVSHVQSKHKKLVLQKKMDPVNNSLNSSNTG